MATPWLKRPTPDLASRLGRSPLRRRIDNALRFGNSRNWARFDCIKWMAIKKKCVGSDVQRCRFPEHPPSKDSTISQHCNETSIYGQLKNGSRLPNSQNIGLGKSVSELCKCSQKAKLFQLGAMRRYKTPLQSNHSVCMLW